MVFFLSLLTVLLAIAFLICTTNGGHDLKTAFSIILTVLLPPIVILLLLAVVVAASVNETSNIGALPFLAFFVGLLIFGISATATGMKTTGAKRICRFILGIPAILSVAVAAFSCAAIAIGAPLLSRSMPNANMIKEETNVENSKSMDQLIGVVYFDDSDETKIVLDGVERAAQEYGIADSVVYKSASENPKTMHSLCDEMEEEKIQWIAIVPSLEKGIPTRATKMIVYDKTSADLQELGYDALKQIIKK